MGLGNRPARLLGLGTAVPETAYSQADVAAWHEPDPRVQAVFRDAHIQTRFLHLPGCRPGAAPPDETQGQLLARHLDGAHRFGVAAARRALAAAGVDAARIGGFVAVTSTGFLTPGLTAHLLPDLGLTRALHRHDVVGMGCNAGLNGLQVAAWQAQARPGTPVLLLCVEVCSAAYVRRPGLGNAVVNSLFGDGAAAAVVGAGPAGVGADGPGPLLLDFESQVIPEAMEAMRFEWDDAEGRFAFVLDRDVPYLVGAHVEAPVDRLLARHRLRRRHVDHWLIHSGGRKVVDAVQMNLGLRRYEVRHTLSVLRDHGNLSSASFLFSLQRLQAEGRIRAGDRAVAITMGPGSTIEAALLAWKEC